MENKIIIRQCEGDGVGGWSSGFPIGNGRLGAMITSMPTHCEQITLNQDSIWYGPKHDRDNIDGKKYYKEIRKLLKAGEQERADKLCYMAMTSQPKYFGAYEPMGTMHVYFNNYLGIDKEFLTTRGKNYEKSLDLEKALVNTTRNINGVDVKSEYFVSAPDQVFVYRIKAEKPILDVHVNFMRRPCDMTGMPVEDTIVHTPGQAGPNGVKFDSFFSAKTDGKMERIGDYIGFSEASEIIIYLTASTDFYEKDPYGVALAQLKAAMKLDYEELKARHIAEHSALYNRSSVKLSNKEDCRSIVERLNALRDGERDPGMLELFYNFGKYILISSSREKSQASNLQGIWNNVFAPMWECNYTVNINLESNYWIAESAGLPECHMPLFDLIDRMVPNGERTAKKLYGCDGFVSHHTTNLWGDTSVEGNSFPSSVWPMGGAWLTLHMWDHYLYTQDREFLEKKAFPVMKKNAVFFSQYLFEDDDGYFKSGPTISPENPYYVKGGYLARHCIGSEIDNQIIRALLMSLLKAYDILGNYDSDYETFKALLPKIHTPRINKNGAILEWDEDFEERDINHRHLSHLFALYPRYEIQKDKTPELARACEKTLDIRFSGRTKFAGHGIVGWADSWAAACHARLGNPDKAIEHLYKVMSICSASLLHISYVMQIDGNMAGAAAISEMLLSSDEERIMLLPALPKEIPSGSFKNLRARGGFAIDLEWQDGKITSAAVTSLAGNECVIKAPGLVGVNTEFSTDGEYIKFNTAAGRSYKLQF
ncbi:MAG: glycoside hydrolase family 95 protein [Ruminococcaceae bacterium]|nr:glycoside hydrolase family 95 protein [Oscillospiraceae bacterium]